MQDHVSAFFAGSTLAKTALQTADILLIGLLAGATFGIWRGYNPSGYAPSTFLEMHQGAVRGLNTLLPVLGALSIALTIALAVMARTSPMVLWFYAVALVLMIAAGLITRFGNQPINALIMDWTPAALPDNWAELRDRWWNWHIARTAASGAATVALILAVFADRARLML